MRKPVPLEHRARQILETVGRAYPGFFRQIDALRDYRGKDLPSWPDWCYCPLYGAHALLTQGGRRWPPFEKAHHIAILGGLAAWRITKGIYRFDPHLYDALLHTDLDRKLPGELLYRLPEWCVYIETPGLVFNLDGRLRPLYGFFAHLDWEEGHDELRFLLDVAEDPRQALDPAHGLVPIPLILGAGGIVDSLERLAESARKRAAELSMSVPGDRLDAKSLAHQIAPLVSLLLYLCTDEAEIGDRERPSNPKPIRTRKGLKLFPADKPTAWDVGVRIGAALKLALGTVPKPVPSECEGPCEGPASEEGRQMRRSPRPHIRRAHWHTFRVGARKEELRLKWLPPIPVNLGRPEELPATIRKVPLAEEG